MTDKQYESLRNLLIPEAEKHANSIAPQPKIASSEAVRDVWVDKWNLAFHTRMDELAREMGLID